MDLETIRKSAKVFCEDIKKMVWMLIKRGILKAIIIF